jgi:DNA-binding transcriptional LysR family regulator
MNRTQLTAFAAVAQAGGFTKGARKLRVSQPAVSLQVSELEAALKAKLFDRLPRGVRLTPAGELLLGYARRIDSLEREAESAVAEMLGLRRGKLVIGASLTIGSYFLPTALGQFRHLYPEIELELEIANTQQIEQALLENRLDLAFTEGLSPKQGLSSQKIRDDRLVPICPPGHPILKLPRITAAIFCQQPLILRELGSGTREVIEDALRKGKHSVKPLMSLGSTEAIKRAVQTGIGLSIVSELAIQSELAAKTLVVVSLKDLAITRTFQLLRPANKSDSPAATAFVDVVRQAATEMGSETRRSGGKRYRP